jgi:hypothetical protein
MTVAVNTVDANNSGAAVPIMLTELRLPTIKRLWADLAAQSNPRRLAGRTAAAHAAGP